MKRITLSIILISVSIMLQGQNTFPTTGNVGIGTMTPSSKLEVVGQNVSFFSGTAYNIFQIGRNFNEKISLLVEDNNFYFDLLQDSDSNNSHIMYFRNQAQGTSSDNDIRFQTSSTDRLTIKTNGNIGIGTTSPGYKLDVAGDINTSGKLFFGNSNHGIVRDANDVTLYTGAGNVNFATTGSPYGIPSQDKIKMTIANNGNIGIGTTNPDSKLHIYDGNVGVKSTYASTIIEGVDAQLDIISSSDGTWGSSINFIEGNGSTNTNNWSISRQTTAGNGDSSLRFNFGTNNQHNNPTKVTFDDSGNVGIGTTSPDSKLAVNGKIHTKEVKVDLVGWSDFVFEKEYELPTLQEVEKHIKEKGHLQNIPSAKEVAKNGILLGEMNKKLLQKIEELTLYTIAQEKKIALSNKNDEKLLSIIQKLEKRIQKLEK